MLVAIEEVDPQGSAAMELLRLAAEEAWSLYPEFHFAGTAPSNEPTPVNGVYLVATADGRPVAMGAHRPIDSNATELRRMFVEKASRRHGLARRVLAELEAHAGSRGFRAVLLETGIRQQPAMALYESCGYSGIQPFGPYAEDPTSVCYEKVFAPASRLGA